MRVRVNRLLMRWRTSAPRRQGGAAAVEMALLAPLLVLLGYGVIEFGIIFAQDLGMGNGAREGARFAASTPTLDCDNAADDDLLGLVLDATNTTLLDDDPGSDELSQVSIRVSAGPDADLATVVCGVDPGNLWVDVPPGGATDVGACDGTSAGDRVFVETRWARGLSIPFGPVASDFEVNGTGVFRCEYK